MAKYKRVLIKLSGEALGDHGRLFDFEQIDRVADVIRQLHETGAVSYTHLLKFRRPCWAQI